MKRRLVIVGAGGFGREIHAWVRTSPQWRERTHVEEVVFVDDRVPSVPVNAPIVSTLNNFRPEARDLVICAIGSSDIRESVVNELRSKSVEFVSFIHDRAVLGDDVVVGIGAVVCPDVIVTSHVTLGEHVHINAGCLIGHDVSIGDFVTLSSACNLTGGVRIGDRVFLATAVTIIPKMSVGAGAFVGAGSVVLKDVPADVTVFGNPGKTIGKRAS